MPWSLVVCLSVEPDWYSTQDILGQSCFSVSDFACLVRKVMQPSFSLPTSLMQAGNILMISGYYFAGTQACGPQPYPGEGLLCSHWASSHLPSLLGRPPPELLGLGCEEVCKREQWVKVALNLLLEDSFRRERRRKNCIWCKVGALKPVSFSRPVTL